MNDVTLTSRNMDNTVAHAGKYANADALVQDARSSLLDEWHKEADDLVVIMGRNLFNSLAARAEQHQRPESQCGITRRQLILSSRTIGGLGFLAPFFPDATMLITSFNNLSIYWQKGSMRRLMKDEPEYNRIATYQSINDAYVVEDYGKCAMVTGLKFADS
ncbi:phage major capsid, P2 family protein [Escherichia coli P0304777.3]|nr:phage major capsid, P2 family protein [Escherichia coli P0304777.3]